MNFISHYFLDRDLDDSWFFAGISTPDLVSVFDRNVRLKKRRMPQMEEDASTPGQISFYKGVMRHFEGDRIFHSSDFFHTETAIITQHLKHSFLSGEVERSFFVAHIALELILDKVLIQTYHDLAPDFYAHLERYPVAEHVKMAEWITQTSLSAYGGFLEKFFTKKYIYSYRDWDHVIYVLKTDYAGCGN